MGLILYGRGWKAKGLTYFLLRTVADATRIEQMIPVLLWQVLPTAHIGPFHDRLNRAT